MNTFIVVWMLLGVLACFGMAAYFGWQTDRDAYAMERYTEVIRRRDHELLIVECAAWLLMCGKISDAKRVMKIIRTLRNTQAVDVVSDVQLHFAINGFSPKGGYTAVDYVIWGAVQEEEDLPLVRTLLLMKHGREAAPVFTEVVKAGSESARRALTVYDDVEAAVLGCVMFRSSGERMAA